MSQQPILRLSLPRNSSEENHVHTARERIFRVTLRSDGEPRKISPQKLFAVIELSGTETEVEP